MSQGNDNLRNIYDEEAQVNKVSLRMLVTNVNEKELTVTKAGKVIFEGNFDKLRSDNELEYNKGTAVDGPIINDTKAREQ